MNFIIKKAELNNGLILVSCVVISSLLTYFLTDINATLWSALSSLHAYNLFNKSKDYNKPLYSLLWSISVLIGIYFGLWLRIGYAFYLYLIILSFFYYQLYNIDPVFDLSMKYIIIFSTIGTILPNNMASVIGITVGLLISTFLTQFVCYSLSHKTNIKIDLKAKYLQNKIFKGHKNIFYSSLIYSTGLMFCLFIPNKFDIGHFYWTLLTFVFILHPKTKSIIKLTAQRTLGTLLVVILLFLIFNTPLMPYIGIITILVLAFLLPLSSEKSYVFTSFCTTGFVLAVMEMSQYWLNPSYSLFFERIIETLLGGSIAIICSILLKIIRCDE